MKKKLFAKVAACMMAVMTTTGVIGCINASAYQYNNLYWGLSYNPNSVPGENVFNREFSAVAGYYGCSSAAISCTSANYCISSGGQTSRARYRGYKRIEIDGQMYDFATFYSKYYTINTSNTTTVSYDVNTVGAYERYYIDFDLQYYTPGSCFYCGYVSY